jgi:glycosyltransferase involved in cell wall biosynthesis
MLHHSGIGTYLKMLLPYMCAEFEVTLLGDAEQLKQFNATASIIQFNAPIYSIAEQRQYRQVIPASDLFWSPHYNAPLLSIKASKRITTIHDVFHLAFFKQLNIKQKIYAKLVINRAVTASDALITVSNFSKKEIIKFTRAKADKVNVIHNGVKQTAVIANLAAITVKYKLPSKYILYVGNVKPHKNLKGLVNAYLRLPVHIQQQYKIVVVGKIEGFIIGDESLLNLIDSQPLLKQNVIFTGFVNDDDMDVIYAAASLFILPSLYEGFGLPPLEAMLNECPVLVSNQNSLPEVCGEAADYFDPLNYGDMVMQIEKVLSDTILRENLVAKGKERVKLFTWANSAALHIELFNRIIHS